MVPDVSYNCKLQLQPHQGALCCIVSVGLLLFLNQKTEKLGVSTISHYRGPFKNNIVKNTPIRIFTAHLKEPFPQWASGVGARSPIPP
jgi:hypothetical protein